MMKKYILSIFIASISSISFAQEWESVPSGTELRLNSISFGSSLVGFIGGNDSLLLKTTDGGDTWIQQATNGVDFNISLTDIVQVDFLDENIGFLTIGTTLYGGQIYKTVDGGANWDLESTWMCSPVRTFNFDENTSFVIGSACFGGKVIDKKENGSWGVNTTYLSWANDYLRAIDFYDDVYGMVAGDGGTVHRTFDGGMHWDTVETFTDESILALKFVNDSTIYGIVDSLLNSFMISTDSGATWASHNSSLTFFYPKLKALALTEYGEVIAVGKTDLGNEGFLLWGKEGATFWNHETVDYPLHGVAIAEDSIAFAVGDSGLIVRNTKLDLDLMENDGLEEISIYPNPVSDVLSIRNEKAEIEKVQVFNMQGKLMRTIDSNFDQIDLSELGTGIYCLTISTKKNRAVHKLIKR